MAYLRGLEFGRCRGLASAGLAVWGSVTVFGILAV